jgi:hypothetical protein
MNAITLPYEFETWAEAEVAAGRADSVQTLTVRALELYREHVEALRRSLDEAVAEADHEGWLTEAEAFDPLLARYPTGE